MTLFAPLANLTYARLFAAQAVALLGTGLLTIALGLVAFRLAGDQGGMVLGIALAIKMIAYVTLAPLANAFLSGFPRRGLLVFLDLVRAIIALCLPFATEVWQIYVLIFLLQAASAAFTPTFQATIPDILPDERDYTRALALSRLAMDIENVASPALAGLLLAVVLPEQLFVGTAAGFLASAALVRLGQIPAARRAPPAGAWARISAGARVFIKVPSLRGLFALDFVTATGGAMVIVNTAVFVQAALGRPETDVALAFAAFGAGSMAAALLAPRLVDALGDRRLMLGAAFALAAVLGLGATAVGQIAPATGDGSARTWAACLLWLAAVGFGYSAVLTPSGRLLPRAAAPEARPALFAARFALSHLCWLVTYPLAGFAYASLGASVSLALMALLALAASGLALMLWTADPDHAAPAG